MVTGDHVNSGKVRAGDKAGAEKCVKSHAAGLCKRHFCIQTHQKRADNSNKDGCNIHRIPDLSKLGCRTADRCQPAVCAFCRDLVWVDKDDVGHCKERGKAAYDLGSYRGSALADSKELVHVGIPLFHELP